MDYDILCQKKERLEEMRRRLGLLKDVLRMENT